MRRLVYHLLVPALLALGGLAGPGCSPPSDAQREYEGARRREEERQETVRSSLERGSDESLAITLAKESPASDGEGTADQWVGRQLAQNTGSVLFPHWQARRYGLEKYEVSFTFRRMNELGEIEKKGYAWKVDLVLKTVSAVRAMTAEELNVGLPRPSARRARPARPPELQLEQ